MYNIILVLHVIVVLCLVGVILVQRGRSGGLVEALGGVESIFGTKTSSFFVKATVVLAILFFSTSLSLAYLSKQRGKSLISKYQKQTQNAESSDLKTQPLAEENNSAQATPGSVLEEVLSQGKAEQSLPLETTASSQPTEAVDE
ncbi:MAG: preprotein translocase subunit SecG [Candidatus Omnitrophica bacterium]|nr:preprotein translocase subunit SecG [Candidatus Omnitrophota bacterium]